MPYQGVTRQISIHWVTENFHKSLKHNLEIPCPKRASVHKKIENDQLTISHLSAKDIDMST